VGPTSRTTSVCSAPRTTGARPNTSSDRFRDGSRDAIGADEGGGDSATHRNHRATTERLRAVETRSRLADAADAAIAAVAADGRGGRATASSKSPGTDARRAAGRGSRCLPCRTRS
jgi:hypothetical protein